MLPFPLLFELGASSECLGLLTQTITAQKTFGCILILDGVEKITGREKDGLTNRCSHNPPAALANPE
jgi:hypothetical protein